MSSIFPYALPFLRSNAASEPRDDREVDDGDCFGVLVGDASTEVDDDEGAESAVFVACEALVRGARVDDIVEG